MKFVKNNKKPGDSNAENAEEDAEKTEAQKYVFSSLRLSLRSLRLCVEYAASYFYFCALNVSIAFSICRSWPPRKSAGVLSTYTSGGTP